MSRYTPEQKAESIRRARELLAELAARDAEDPDARSSMTPWSMTYEPVEDPLDRWRREQLEAESRRDRERVQTAAELNAQRAKDWEAWADAIVARALVEHDRISQEATGRALGIVRKQLRDELAKLQARVAALETKQRAVVAGDVIDLQASSDSSVVRKVRIT
jgi:hypothetical protein